MFNLANVLELVVDRSDECSLAQQQLVNELHQAIFHVLFGLGNELESPIV